MFSRKQLQKLTRRVLFPSQPIICIKRILYHSVKCGMWPATLSAISGHSPLPLTAAAVPRLERWHRGQHLQKLLPLLTTSAPTNPSSDTQCPRRPVSTFKCSLHQDRISSLCPAGPACNEENNLVQCALEKAWRVYNCFQNPIQGNKKRTQFSTDLGQRETWSEATGSHSGWPMIQRYRREIIEEPPANRQHPRTLAACALKLLSLV